MGAVDGFAAVHTTWFLLAWGVVAAASIWKFWRLTASYRNKLRTGDSASASARQTLERAWQKSGR